MVALRSAKSPSATKPIGWMATVVSPGELRLPGVATIIKVRSRTELKDRCRTDTRYYISSANLTAEAAAEAVRGHWGIENRLHWVLDVVFAEDQARLRTGHGAKKHGRRQTLRHQSRARRCRQKIHQAETKGGWMGCPLSRLGPRDIISLTWIRCPAGQSCPERSTWQELKRNAAPVLPGDRSDSDSAEVAMVGSDDGASPAKRPLCRYQPCGSRRAGADLGIGAPHRTSPGRGVPGLFSASIGRSALI